MGRRRNRVKAIRARDRRAKVATPPSAAHYVVDDLDDFPVDEYGPLSG